MTNAKILLRYYFLRENSTVFQEVHYAHFISNTNNATKNKNKLNSEYFIPKLSTFIFLNFTTTIHSTNSN